MIQDHRDCILLKSNTAVDKAVKLGETLGGESFSDMTTEDVNDLIDVHAQPLIDEDLEELTKSGSKEEEEEEEYC